MQPVNMLIGMYEPLRDKMPPFGWINTRIDYILDLNMAGKLIAIIPVNKNYFTPGCDTGRTRNIKAYTLWDKRAYIFGDLLDNDPKANDYQQAFYERTKKLQFAIPLIEISAIVNFLESDPIGQLIEFGEDHDLFKVENTKTNCAFRVGGSEILINNPAVIDYLNSIDAKSEFLHDQVKKLNGTNSKGASLISYNIDVNDHYTFERNQHDCISYGEMCKYTAVMQYLVDNQRIKTGDDTDILYATDVNNQDVNDIMTELFGYSAKPTDDSGKVSAAVSSIMTGNWVDATGNLTIIETRGMVGRIAITNCQSLTYQELFGGIKKWFDVMGTGTKLWQVLKSFEIDGKKLHPHIKRDLSRSILLREKLPTYVINEIADRLRSPNTDSKSRSSLTNLLIFANFGDNMNTYSACIGRLMMTYEALQKASADNTIGVNVTDKYMRQLLINPENTIATIATQSVHWSTKLRRSNPGGYVWYSKMIDELMQLLANAEKTPINKLEVHIGYSHQRTEIYKKKSD